MALNPRQITSADLFFFFYAPKFFNKPFEFLCRHLFRATEDVTACKEQQSRHSISYFLFFTRCDVMRDLLQYTRWHARKTVIYLLNIKWTGARIWPSNPSFVWIT